MFDQNEIPGLNVNLRSNIPELGLVVQRLDSTIHRIDLHWWIVHQGFADTYLLNSNLSLV